MATNMYNFGATPGTVVTNLITALQSKSLITSILYQDAEYLIFTTPLTSKVVKIRLGITSGSSEYYFYTGDAWTSGTTITSQVQHVFAGYGSGGRVTGFDVFVDSNFFFICFKTGSYNQSGMTYLGKLTNGDCIVMGLAFQASAVNSARNLTTNSVIYPIFITTNNIGVRNAEGKIYSLPLMFADASGVLYLNNSLPAEAIGIKLSTSNFCGLTNVVIGADYYLTHSVAYIQSEQKLQTSILIPHTV